MFTNYRTNQYVVVPTRRSTAEAFQILISHTLGDAGSPYLVGVVSVSLDLIFCNCLLTFSFYIFRFQKRLNEYWATL